MTRFRRVIGSWGTLLATVSTLVASCRDYELCSEGRDACTPDAAGRAASAAGEPEGGKAGEGGLGGGATGEDGAAGSAGESGAGTSGKAGRGGTAGTSPAGEGGAGAAFDAGGGGIAGDGGEAGRAGASCAATFGDCDGSTLNGCETKLLESVRHCGACDRECAGLCVQGDCLEFERLVADQFSPENIALAPDYAFLAAHDASDALRLRRVSRWTGEIDTLSSKPPWRWIRASAVGSKRLYVADQFELKSLALDGTDLRDEGLYVESIAASGGFLYFAWLGSLYSWSETDRAAELVRAFEAAESSHLVASGLGVFVAVNYPAGIGPAHYELHFLFPTSEPSLLDAGAGVASGLVAAQTDAYFAVLEGTSVALRHVPHGSQASVLDADASEIVELAAVTGGVFATFSTATSWGLRYYAFNASAIRYEWETRGDLLRLTSTADGELWFVDSSQAALARLKTAAHDLLDW
ncbi:MAG TPA: hypothetical protein VGK73_11090 [Polyangiaceae bacterium]